MRHSEQIGELAKALAASQAEFQPVTKSRQGHHGAYADIADVVETTLPIIAKNGLAVVQSPGVSEGGHEVLTTMLMHTSGQWVADDLPLHPLKSDPQAQGSAITYARRYAYCAMLGVVADDDDDGEKATAAAKNAPRKAQAQKQSPAAKPCPRCNQPIAGQPVVRLGGDYIHKRCMESDDPGRPFTDDEQLVGS